MSHRLLRKSLILCFSLGLIAPVAWSAPPIEVPRLREHLQKALQEHDIPGGIVSVMSAGEISRVAAGVRVRGTTARIQLNDAFHIGSCFKAFTATTIALWIQRGKLRWESTLGEIFPELDKTMTDSLKSVTVLQLATHRAGIDDTAIPQSLQIESAQATGSPYEVRKKLLPKFLSLSSAAPVGNFLYSNIGYAILGGVIERISGDSFERVVKRDLLRPLQMRSVRLYSPGSNDLSDTSAVRGHSYEGAPTAPDAEGDKTSRALSPAGLYRSTIRDWERFINLHFRGRTPTGRRLLTQQTLNTLHTPPPGPFPVATENYAPGWIVSSGSDRRQILQHAGSNNFWLSYAFVVPNQREAILILLNQEMSQKNGTLIDSGMRVVNDIISSVRLKSALNNKEFGNE